jgi:hypothetical protein
MDLTTAAVTITQLIGLYRQEAGARTDCTHREFIEWLEYHRHGEIKELITHTFHLQSQVDDLLRRDHDEIIAKLDQVNQIVADILARVDGLASVTVKIVPNLGLSDEAIGMLRLLAKSESGELFSPGEGQLIVDACLYKSTDPKFLQDDLDSLVTHTFFSIDYSERGKPFYRITRRGAQFFAMLPEGGS